MLRPPARCPPPRAVRSRRGTRDPAGSVRLAGHSADVAVTLRRRPAPRRPHLLPTPSHRPAGGAMWRAQLLVVCVTLVVAASGQTAAQAPGAESGGARGRAAAARGVPGVSETPPAWAGVRGSDGSRQLDGERGVPGARALPRRSACLCDSACVFLGRLRALSYPSPPPSPPLCPPPKPALCSASAAAVAGFGRKLARGGCCGARRHATPCHAMPFHNAASASFGGRLPVV